MFTLGFSTKAKQALEELAGNPALRKRYKAVNKALGYLQANPRHPSLNTHKFSMDGEEIFEAYAENNTPGAYRIFWHYGPGKQVISIADITPHP